MIKFKDILLELNQLPASVKKLKNLFDYKDLDNNSIFKNKYVQKYRIYYNKLEAAYYKNGGRRLHGGSFMKTGIITTKVDVSEIYPGQPGVEGESILKIFNGDTAHVPSSELPEAIKLNNLGGIILLIDGHHRVAASILKGKTEIELILKIDKFV